MKGSIISHVITISDDSLMKIWFMSKKHQSNEFLSIFILCFILTTLVKKCLEIKKLITSNLQMAICTSQNYSTFKSFLNIIACDVTWQSNAKYFRCHLTPAIECRWKEYSGLHSLIYTLIIACLNKCHWFGV